MNHVILKDYFINTKEQKVLESIKNAFEGEDI